MLNALHIYPFDVSTRAELAALYVSDKEYDDAIRELKINCELQPKVSEHYARLAMVFKTAGKLDEAHKAAEQAVKLDPDSPAKDLLENN